MEKAEAYEKPKIIVAKLHCDVAGERVNQHNPSWKPDCVELSVVGGLTPEDRIFAASTPGGEVKLQIISEAAKGFFKPGKKYYVRFEEANE